MSDSESEPPSSLEEAVKQPDGDLQILTHSPSPSQGKTLLPAELVEVKCEALEADTEPQTPQEVGKAEHEDAKVDGVGAGEATFVHCEIVKAELPDCANRFEEELPLSSLAGSPEVQPLGCRQHRLVVPKNLGVHSLPAASEEVHSSQLPAACGDWPQQTEGAALRLVVQLTEGDRASAEASTAVPSSIQCADAKRAGLTSVKTESEDPTSSPSMVDVISEDPDYIAPSPSASPVAESAPSSDFVAPLPESRPHPCEECGKGFPNRGQLRRHMLTHTGERRHLCSQCAQRFTHYTHLLSHEKAVHEGEKPHSCEVCGRGFSQVANLYRHIRTHTGERPFVCGDCGRTFAQQTGLMRHRRSHTGERPYECPECGSAFTQKVNLTQHLRVHTGERPYVCSTCSRGFAQRSNLYAHMRSAHGVSRPGRTTNAVLGQGYSNS